MQWIEPGNPVAFYLFNSKLFTGSIGDLILFAMLCAGILCVLMAFSKPEGKRPVVPSEPHNACCVYRYDILRPQKVFYLPA